jgi:BASS family bile acid:Na+ symporter
MFINSYSTLVCLYLPHACCVWAQAVQRVRIYTPLLATVLVVMIVGSMISTNVDVVSRSGLSILTAVLTLHSCGFGLGYGISKALGLSDRIARTNSIEVRRSAMGSP